LTSKPERSLKEHLREYGGRPKRSLGQVFLIERSVQQKILEVSRLEAQDVVVEIGPGTGALTRELVRRVKRLVALELDQALALYLRSSLRDCPNLYLICTDALRFDYRRAAARFGAPLKVVGNLPYVISSPLLFTFAEQRASFSLLTLMIQKEVAERLTAQPGNRTYGAMTVLCNRHFTIEILRKVSRYCFSPVPGVDSAVIQCTPRNPDFLDPREEDHFVALVKAAFSKRRKTLFNALRLSGRFGPDESLLAEAMGQCSIEPSRRPETLNMDEFRELARCLRKMAPDRRQAESFLP